MPEPRKSKGPAATRNNGRIWVCGTTPASAALIRVASARTRWGDARAASTRARTAKRCVPGFRAGPPVVSKARAPARILGFRRREDLVIMPTPVPTDIMVRPRVPEAPSRPLPPGSLLASATAALASFEPDKMSLDAHADAFFAAAEEGAFGLELKRFDASRSDRLRGRHSWGAKTRDPEDQTFVRQVLYGATRYSNMLDAFVAALYDKHAARLSRREKLEARVCAYLALLRLDELGMGALGAILKAHPSGVRFAVPFLEFAFDTAALEEAGVVRKWLERYDDAFVANAIGFLERHAAEARVLAEAFTRELTLGGVPNDASDDDDDDDASSSSEPRLDASSEDVGEGDDAKRSSATRSTARDKKKSRMRERTTRGAPSRATVPKPFNLRPSRPRPAPPVQVPVAPFKANPVPISTRRAGPTADAIAVRRAETRNREAVAKKYADPKLVFRLTAIERPSNLDKVRAEMEARERSEMEAVSRSTVPIARPVPSSNAPGFVDPKAGPIKTTAAAILRADAALRRKREKEIAAVEDFEIGLRDSSEYEAWRLKTRLEDEARRKLEIRETREEMARSNEEARAARAAAARANAELGAATRETRESLKQRRDALEKASLERNQASRHRVSLEKRKGLDDSRKALAEERRKAAEARTAERAATAARLAEARRKALAEKAELVREIRALAAETDRATVSQSLAHDKRTQQSVTSNAHGAPLLEDMSMAELRERLALVAARAEAKEKRRREAIRAAREARADGLARKLADLESHRRDASLSSKQRKEARLAEDEKRRALVEAKRAEDARAAELRAEAKRAARARAKKVADAEAEAERFANATRPANDPTLARRKERSVLLSRAREANRDASEARKASFAAARARATEKRAVLERRDEENARKSKFELEYEARLRAAGKADETMRRDDARRKREAVESERARVESVRGAFRGLAYDGEEKNASTTDEKKLVAKSAVGPASLRAAGLASDVSRGAFGRKQKEKTDALREAYREEFGAGGGLTRDTMLDAPAASGGVARTIADERVS